MLDTSARLLRLLSLLQARRDWSGADLADRLGVTPRTVRRDVDRLRHLGYPVHATPGTAGGYRLGAGAALPPLLLDDDEAIAVAVGLRTAAGGTVAGIEETSVRALAKLEQVLPARLRHRVSALQAVTVPLAGSGPTVDPGTLTLVAAACRDQQRLRFDYRHHDGTQSVRTTGPRRGRRPDPGSPRASRPTTSPATRRGRCPTRPTSTGSGSPCTRRLRRWPSG